MKKGLVTPPRGFGLVEVIVVAVIVMVLAGVASIAYNFAVSQARLSGVQTDARAVSTLLRGTALVNVASIKPVYAVASNPVGDQQLITSLPWGADVPLNVDAVQISANGTFTVAADGYVCSGLSYLESAGGEPTCSDVNEVAAVAPLTADEADENVVLQWQPAETTTAGVTVDAYEVAYSEDDGDSWEELGMVTPSVTEVAVAGLENGTEYDFKVTPTSIVGEGDEAEVSAVPLDLDGSDQEDESGQEDGSQDEAVGSPTPTPTLTVTTQVPATAATPTATPTPTPTPTATPTATATPTTSAKSGAYLVCTVKERPGKVNKNDDRDGCLLDGNAGKGNG